MLINTNLEGLLVVLQSQVDFNHIFLLERYQIGINFPSDPKIDSWKQTLVRKGFLDGEDKVTPLGQALLSSITSGVDTTSVVKKEIKAKLKDDFDKWWEIYPSTDAFSYKGKVFKGTQSKKLQKEVCKKHFKESEFKAEDILRATEYHIQMARELSIKKGESQLSYIPNSERYLRTKAYEPYIEMSKIKTKSDNNNNIVDI